MPTRNTLARHLRTAHPSTEPFLRAFLLGYAAHSVPAVIRVLLSSLLSRTRKPPSQVLSDLAKAVARGFHPRGLGVAFGVAIGGAKWAEEVVEPVVRSAYAAGVARARAVREGKGKARETEFSLEAEQQRVVEDERNVKVLSTFVGSTISSLVALLILQSSKAYRRPARPTAQPVPDLQPDFLISPYTPGPSSTPDPTPRNSRRIQSPTLDLTLFLFVRGTDTFLRYLYSRAPPTQPGKRGALIRLLASHGDTLVFWLACWRIMFSFFYSPQKLPPGYSKWIMQLARLDPRLLQLLRFAREGRYVYGRDADAEVVRVCEGIAKANGKPLASVHPLHTKRIDCALVHGQVGAGTCEQNALKRWVRAFLDCLVIYLPVHAIPQLLFNLRRILSQPSSSLARILLAASRSSTFLATFVASIYASVCLIRTRLPQLVPSVPQQPLDAGLCVMLGCAVCGFSVLIENKRRRREMALYVAPRALYAMLDDLIPPSLLRGRVGDTLSTLLERLVFSFSAGTVITAAVHRPELVSGVVKGVTGFAVGRWGGERGAKGVRR
ncbi:Para-aminobenzoate synthase, subunit I [Rhodotorula toruloides ATCC 204091]|uniref:Para-aminobenzoate synthase, subunit I n=1 Tax=Rhodotorula toruloides TaxID=5286 RepID=A0A0K3CHK8_RHOTO|nr:Para-aminobenzoate synthase, subunit I [Rhodotorula toruloides ATCC 204091]KAK4332456.1 Para-aminobenzoate synthase, subunit I [Rhodotorula toruloides]PRQ72747.1 para-aminobenzoate synthase, subunit I [Rhodotorula toruloides]